MIAIVILLIGGLTIFGFIIGWRSIEAKAWRRSLVALAMQFPRRLTADQVGTWLAMLGSMRVVIGIETRATKDRIAHYLIVPKKRQADVLAGSRAILPGLHLEEASDYLTGQGVRWQAATELRITHLSHQLATDRAESAAAAMLGALGEIGIGEKASLQWLIVGTKTPRARAANDPAKDLARAEKVKHASPILQAVGRVGVTASYSRRSYGLLNRIVGTLRVLDAPGVAVVRRPVPASLVTRRLVMRSWPLVAWPVVVNTKEAAALVAVPMGDTTGVPGLTLGRSRHLPPGQLPSRGGTAIAVSNYPGREGQRLVLPAHDRLRHVYCVGPTGVGKSSLLAQMAVQDATAGYGLCLVDPKGDLCETILARLPETVTDRLIVLDPSQTDRPVGLNPLAVDHADEHGRELAADRVLHIFKDLYRSNWGPRTDDVIRAALLSLVSVRAPNGQAFTICEIPELLTRPALRGYVTRQPGLPEQLKTYWSWFDRMSESEQLQHIGPVMNKLRAFTMRTATRLLLGQSDGLDLADIMCKRGVLLVSLAKGRIGTETATLAGSLIVTALWQAALTRVNLAPERRRPFFVYLDEFQDVVRLSDSLPDLLSQARGMGVGAVLANQYLAQLSESVRAAVLGTVRSQVVFQVEHDDGRLLERRFAPNLAADDLMGLGRYEVAIRPCFDGATLPPVTGTTLPLSEPVRDSDELAHVARERWGRPRSEVEADLQARVGLDGDGPGLVGRVPRRRQS
ncbi:MAG TPA: type IV secretion system DNA-binding domain-containing protein [Streptosporangiaceae bacterium]